MASTSIRNFRILVLGGIFFTAAITGSVYISRHRTAPKPRPHAQRIAANVINTQDGFSFSNTDGNRTTFKATAKKATDYRDTGKSKLEGVELQIFGKNGDRHDLITTGLADYDSNTGKFYSDGEVIIRLGSLPGQTPLLPGAPPSEPTVITTTGLLYDQKKGTATTDRPLQFEFRDGSGTATGAAYNSTDGTVWLKSEVVIHLERDRPVDIHAAELHYLQKEHQVQLNRPEFRREGQALNSDTGTLFLDEKQQAKSGFLDGNVHGNMEGGTPEKPRTTEFWSSHLDLTLNDKQQVTAAVATGNPHMDSRGSTGRSEGRADRLEMDLTGEDNTLKQAQWKGGAKMVFTPPPAPGPSKAQTRIITAEQIEINMKDGGKEVSTARTLTPGRVELVGGTEPRRVMTARQIWADFGERNTIHEMKANGQVRTESDPPSTAPAGSPLRITTSDSLDAIFDNQQQLQKMSQTGAFQYHEGDRQATAELAVYTATPGGQSSTTSGTTVLTGKPGTDPQVWDPQGRVIAKKITMPDQKADAMSDASAETTAEGEVRGTQMPAKKDDKPGQTHSAVLTDDKEPIHVLTDRLRWDRKTGLSHYQGGPNGRARLWQGQDVIEARTLDLENTKDKKNLTGTGDVFSTLVQKDRDPLRVSSDRYHYDDVEHHARYEGSVVMKTGDITVTSAVADAWLRPADEVAPGQSRLEHAVANGKVHMNQPVQLKDVLDGNVKHKAHPARQGDAENAVYTTDDDKLVLTGGPPVVHDEVRGSTTGRELTWLTADDKIFVDGGPDVRTLTQHRVVKKKP
jgi:lipopolysaccharide export system protein LptA